MRQFRVSTIIPAYRAARTINRAIDSLMAQTRPSDEILVVDDGSPDDLAQALEPYGDLVTLIRKPNGGAASARNLGIERSRGDLVAFLDADDYWEPTKLERQLSVFRDHPEIGMVAGRYYIEPPGRPRTIYPVHHDEIYEKVTMSKNGEVFDVMEEIWTTTVVVRRECLADLRFMPGLEPAEDRDLWIRLAMTSPVYLLAEPLATYVLEPGSLSRSNIDRDCSNMLKVVHRHRYLLDTGGLLRWEAYVFRRWAAGHLGNRRAASALPHAWARLRRQPFSPEAWWILGKCAALTSTSGRRDRSKVLACEAAQASTSGGSR